MGKIEHILGFLTADRQFWPGVVAGNETAKLVVFPTRVGVDRTRL